MTALRAEPTAAAVKPKDRKFRPDVEGLRAVAILLVVLYHANLTWLPGGYVGVDVFFVISGFLITRQLVGEVARTGRLSISGFYARRMRRLLPASTVVILVTLGVAKLYMPVLQLKSVARDAMFTVAYAMNFRLAAVHVNYLNASAPPSPLQHFWSLAVEEQFYAIWPLLILTVAVAARRNRQRTLRIVLSILAMSSLGMSVAMTSRTSSAAYFGLHTRAWELATGALIAITADRLANLPKTLRSGASWLGLAFIAVAGTRFTTSTLFPGYAALLPVGGAALVIAAGCANEPRGAERLLALRPAQVIGKVSYSWYLWHWPCLILAPYVLHREALPTTANMLVVAVALVLAVVTFVLVEAPTRSLRLPRLAWIASGFSLSAVAAVAAVAVGTSVPALRGHGVAVTLTSTAPFQAAPHRTGSPGGSSSETSSPAPTFQQILAVALSAGLETTAAPSNLTPSLDRANVDSPASTFDGCHEDYLATTQGPCVYGDPAGAKTVVLFGDSHMEQWQPAFDLAGKSLHWRVVNWTKATCPLANVMVVSAVLHRAYPECNAWKKQTIARIAALHPNLVVAGSGDDDSTKPFSDAAWSAATVATLQTLKAAVGVPVLYMEDTPFADDRSAPCIAKHLDDVHPCDFAVSDAYHSLVRHEAQHAAVTAAGFPTVDPIHWLCTAGRCPVIVGNVLVYRDRQHISTTYSRWVAPAIAGLLVHDWAAPSR